ncbi:MAG: Type I Iterative PKS, partial [Chaenotheca gracillima]
MEKTQHNGSTRASGSTEDPVCCKKEPPSIAIVGMACRLPGGVSDLEGFWEFCEAGRNAWTKFPTDRFNSDAFYHPNPEKAGCLNIKGSHFLKEDVALFDAPFFNITAGEAPSIDPRQRLLLECVYEALENAGISTEAVAGEQVGVYVGNTLSHYELLCMRDPETAPRLQSIGCADTFLANRISYFYDLHGPSITVDTACSSGVSALHMACQSLRAGEVSSAVVGGCQLSLAPEVMMAFSSAGLYSADGRSFPFDERASGGFGAGEGTACLILKPLQAAIDAGDSIRAVIRNTGLNQDGRTLGITMPSSKAQEALISSVYHSASLDLGGTAYVEAHGTGTSVGDPLEAAAIDATFGKSAHFTGPVFIGSAKSNFGHLEGVSGIVSVIKATLMLEKRILLPNADFQAHNPLIPSLGKTLKVLSHPLEWKSKSLRRVSVNNLGFGGTNGHVILEEFNHPEDCSVAVADKTPSQLEASIISQNGALKDEIPHVFVLSANDQVTVMSQMKALSHYVEAHHNDHELMHDLAFTLGQRRSSLQWKIAFTASTTSDFVRVLEKNACVPTRSSKEPRIGFVFTGQGAQWSAMGRELLGAYPCFLKTVEDADGYLTELGATWSLLDELSKDPPFSRINEASISQPACTAVQVALVKLFESWGIRPHSVTGHSSGEIAAAFATGSLSLKSCMAIAYHRGLMAMELKKINPSLKGAMLALGTNRAEAVSLVKRLTSGLAVVACVNSPSSVTISGDEEAIDELQKIAGTLKLFSRKLEVDVAYHSPHMNSIVGQYRLAMGRIQPTSSKQVKFFSSLSGNKMNTLILGSSYWASNLVSQVQFMASLRNMCSLGHEDTLSDDLITHLVEIGPHSALKGAIRDTLGADLQRKGKVTYSPTLLRGENAVDSVLNLACDLFSRGVNLDMSRINASQQSRVPRVLSDLPPYPWNHENSYWHESRFNRVRLETPFARNDLLGRLCEESSDLAPRWRNIIRLDDLPWLRDHKIRSNAVFPFAGYLSMAVEASVQRAKSRGSSHTRIEFREVSVNQALVIHEAAEVEMLLALEPLQQGSRVFSDVWDHFTVSSWTTDTGWIEHCRGNVAALLDDDRIDRIELPKDPRLLELEFEESLMKIETSCVLSIDQESFYKTAKAFDIEYGPVFVGLSDYHIGRNAAVGLATIPDTASVMPRRYESDLVVHPATLDICLQSMLGLLGSSGGEMDEVYLPTFMKNICIRSDVKLTPGDSLRVFATSTDSHPHTERNVESISAVSSKNTSDRPIISFKGLVMTPLSDGGAPKGNESDGDCLKVEWQPYIDSLSSCQMRQLFRPAEPAENEIRELRVLEELSLYYCERVLRLLDEKALERLSPHHKGFYQSIQKQSTSLREDSHLCSEDNRQHLDESKRLQALGMSSLVSVAGKLISKIGERLEQILLQGLEPLSIMLEEDLLGNYYADFPPFNRCYAQAAKLVDCMAHQNPNLSILEIGAGTGGASLPLLEALGGSGSRPRFETFVYTDISSGFFEKAKAKLTDWGSLLAFSTLNIEQDPVSQGYVEHSFDLIVAANVLHATAHMSRTMENVRRLLKPGGKLLLIEITSPKASLFPFSLLPGWWLNTDTREGEEKDRANGPLMTEQRWDSLLRTTGFSGVDVGLPDYDEQDLQSVQVMLSTADDNESSPNMREVVIVCSNPSSCFANGPLSAHLSLTSTEPARILPLIEISRIDLSKSVCVFLDEVERPILARMSAEELRAVQHMCSGAGLLWVTRGAQFESQSPDSSMVFGLARTLRIEFPSLKLITFDLDGRQHLSEPGLSEVIAFVHNAAFVSGSQSARETEYAERRGQLFIPRAVPDDSLTQAVRKVRNKPVPEVQTYEKAHHSLSLDIQLPGFLDSLFFATSDAKEAELDANEIHVDIKAFALNFHDLMVAMGKIPFEPLGTDCAGIVTAIGKNVCDVSVGDRIYTLVPNACSTSIRCNSAHVAKIPNDLEFEVAASLPTICCTTLHCLLNVAGLLKGEKILIHSAAGGVGQIAIMLSQSIGAEVFATVGNTEKKELLINQYGLLPDHIFYSRDSSFEQSIQAMTKNKGVDVVLNSLPEDRLQASWRCLAPFGRFVELGKKDFLVNNRLDMEPFLRNRTFAGIDMAAFAIERPLQVKKLLDETIRLLAAGQLRPVGPIKAFPLSDVEKAFRSMQSGENLGKVVLTPQVGDRVKILPRTTSLSSLRSDVTYLITGGSGGLARPLSRWLAERGAKHILLASRRGGDEEHTKSLIEELGRSGTRVVPWKCDITVAENVEVMVQESALDMPPIGGDCLFDQMSAEEYMSVVKPKVAGAWNLHNALLGNDIDFFVMLSSVVGITGNQGQSAYGAASSFLDAFASYRNSLGLPGTTIDLGAVTDTGYLSDRPDLRKNATNVFGQALGQTDLLALVDASISGYVGRDQNYYAGRGIESTGHSAQEQWIMDPKFCHLIRNKRSVQGNAISGSPAVSVKQRLKEEISLESARDLVYESLVAKFCLVLMIAEEDIRPDKALAAYGTDSLVAVELRNWITREMEASVLLMDLLAD